MHVGGAELDEQGGGGGETGWVEGVGDAGRSGEGAKKIVGDDGEVEPL